MLSAGLADTSQNSISTKAKESQVLVLMNNEDLYNRKDEVSYLSTRWKACLL
jgi:hypothetical protein